MDWLNYHHLYYFWTTARLGSISAAADDLNLARPTISAQLKQLEKSMGHDLFDRSSRRIQLSEFGQTAFRYAEEIFSTGREFQDLINGHLPNRTLRFRVGMPDALPKLITYRLLKPILELKEQFQVVCVEGKLDDLLADLAVHRLDLVLSDVAVNPTLNVRAYNHQLGECGVTFFGKSDLLRDVEEPFPQCLASLPLLQPVETTSLRRALDQWFEGLDVRPQVRAEFEDTALMKVFGQAGEGIFPAPTAIEQDVCEQYKVEVIGRTEEVKERFFAISVERRIKHPAVLAISKNAKDLLL